jgi:hypothetical protein
MGCLEMGLGREGARGRCTRIDILTRTGHARQPEATAQPPRNALSIRTTTRSPSLQRHIHTDARFLLFPPTQESRRRKQTPGRTARKGGGDARKKPNLVAAIVLFFSSFDGSVFLFFFQRVSTSSTFAIPSAIFYFLISYIFLKKKPLSMLADNDERLVICRMILIVVRTFKCRV